LKLYEIIRPTIRLLGIERLYSWILEKEVRDGIIPEHVAIIMDGNRRWASEKGMPKRNGYRYGADVVERVMDWCLELGVKTLTLYVLSLENLNRPKEELDAIFEVLEERIERLIADERLMREKVRFKVMGDVSRLPPSLKEKLRNLELLTKDNSKRFLNVAISYSGREEILKAVRDIVKDVKEGRLRPEEIDHATFEKRLFTSHLNKADPDLIIRTSGEVRISGFLLWQSAYSELVFLDVYWPDFRKIDLLRAIRTFQRRKRRFGL
jgi:tritrans,polycis-undecaprenyl-diphosphate synthase [geranylgeranyl-diphosphate specific]